MALEARPPGHLQGTGHTGPSVLCANTQGTGSSGTLSLREAELHRTVAWTSLSHPPRPLPLVLLWWWSRSSGEGGTSWVWTLPRLWTVEDEQTEAQQE